MNGRVYIKQNENSRPVVILNMNVLRDMFPNFYDLSKEGNENREFLEFFPFFIASTLSEILDQSRIIGEF